MGPYGPSTDNDTMVLLMRELPLQNYIVRLRHLTRPSGINQGRPVIQGTHQLEDPGNLAIDTETIVDIGI